MEYEVIPGSTIYSEVAHMNGISNPPGYMDGAYFTFGLENYWEKDGAHWLWARCKYHPIISIIHHFLNVIKANIHGYDGNTRAKK